MSGNEKPQMILKPRIIAGIFPKFLGTFIIFGIFFFYLGGFLSIFFGVYVSLLLFIIIIFLSVLLSYMNLRAREYRFFGDRAEFYEGFLNINRRIVRYDRVTDISFNRSVWERIWGTGSILLNTAGSHYRELKLRYIRNPELTYETVQSLVKRYSGGRTGTESYSRSDFPKYQQRRYRQ